MSDQTTQPDGDGPVLNVLAAMTAASLEQSALDIESLLLVRIAALVAVDAPPVSYLLNLSAAGDMGITSEQVEGVLAAVAPIVGTARIVAAASKISRALGIAIAITDAATMDQAGDSADA